MNRFDIGRCHCKMSHTLSACDPPRARIVFGKVRTSVYTRGI